MRVSEVVATNNRTAVVGIGATGLSVARYLSSRGDAYIMLDTRENPPGLGELEQAFPTVAVELGDLNADTLLNASSMVLSPGLSTAHPAIVNAMAAGVPLLGDIQLFADAATAPIVAITGSNGKSTVTTLVGLMAEAAGLNVGVGGNLGTPALDLLDEQRDLYVIELSSFQLELVENIHAAVAVVLNVTPDHMDRYADLQAYHRAKQRIFRGVEQVVVNRQDALSQPLVSATAKQWTFGLDKPVCAGFGVDQYKNQDWLYFEDEPLLPLSSVAIKGTHNIANALAALALGYAVNIPLTAMLSVLQSFKGLQHRCENIGLRQGILWINDSKATNVGAAIAAIEGLAGESADIILLAGGQAKGQVFDDLGETARGKVKFAILFGEDANVLANALDPHVKVTFATSLENAVVTAAEVATAGDKVLLSPACASFDMFKGYEHRGSAFAEAVGSLK